MTSADDLAAHAVSPAPPTARRDRSWLTVVGATLVLGVLVFVVAPHSPWPFWSLLFFRDYPWPLQLAFVLAPAVLTVGLGRAVTVAARRIPARVPGTRATALLSMALASLAVFWLLRERRHWGDAAYTIDILEGRADVGPLGRYFWKEPLDRLLSVLFTSAGRSLLGWGAEASVALMSALAGSAFVVALWLASARLGRTGPGRLFAFGLTLSMGASQLFFGHVENYTLVTLLMMMFFREGLEALTTGGSWIPVWLWAAVAVTAHPLASFLIAPLLALPLLRESPPTPVALRRFAFAALPGLAYLGLFYAFCRALGALPLEIGVNRFGEASPVFLGLSEALSARHLWDVAQNYLLTLPAGALVVLIQWRRRRGEADRRDAASVFLGVAALSFLVFSLFMHGILRRRRDWDLFAPAALPVALLAARLLAGRLERGRSTPLLAFFLVLFSLAVSGPWIVSNWLDRPAASAALFGRD